MKNKLYQLREYFLIALFLTLAIIIIFYPYIFQGKQFAIIADQQLQYQFFYEEWIKIVNDFMQNHTFSFYSFSSFLGADFFASKTYYVIGDIFLPLILIFKNINRSLLLITLILIYLSGFSFNLLLSNLNIKNHYLKIALAICYALSGISSLYWGNYMFHRFYALLPLLFVGVEHYLTLRKGTLFSIMVLILFMQNYYLMFPTTIFLIPYFSLSYLAKEKFNFKLFFTKALKLIGYYIIGLLASSFILIPTISFLSNNPRIGQTTTQLFWPLKVYLGYFFSYLIPPFNLNTDIPFMFYYGNNGHAYWYSMFSSSLVCLCLPTLFFSKKKNHQRYLITALIILSFLFIRPLNSIIHGFSEASFRWTFILVLAQLIVVAKIFDDQKQLLQTINKAKNFLFIFYGFLIIIALVFHIMSTEYQLSLIVLFINLLLCPVFYYLIIYQKQRLLMLLVVLQVFGFSYALVSIYQKDYYYYDESLDQQQLQTQLAQANPLTRIYINPSLLQPTSTLNLNQSLHYNYLSTTTYDSTYDATIKQFLQWNGIDWHIIDLNNPEILQLLGVRYVGIGQDIYLDNNFIYTYAFSNQAISFYELNDYNSIAHTYNQVISTTNFNQQDYHDFTWNNTLIIDEELIKQYPLTKGEKQQLIIQEQFPNGFKGSINSTSNCFLLVTIPYSSSWQVKDQDNNILPIYQGDGGFMVIPLADKQYSLTFSYQPSYLLISQILSICGIFGILTMFIYDRKKQHHLQKED